MFCYKNSIEIKSNSNHFRKITRKLATKTFKPPHSLLAFYQMKKDIQVENSNKNSTMKTNVRDYTDQIMTVFSTWTIKKKKLQIPRSCFNNIKEKN